MNTTALTFFSLSFFSAFLLFCVFAVSGFFGGLFLRGMKKPKKDKIQNKTTKKQERKKDHKMQIRRPLSLMTKKQQHRNKIIQMNSLNWKETTQENKQKQTHKPEKPNYPFNQHSSKNTRIAGKTAFFQRLKAKQERRTKTKTQNKTKEKHQKQSQHDNKKTERLKHTQ